MSEQLQNIKTLIRKYINGNATIDQIVAIDEWLKEDEGNKSVFVAIKEELAFSHDTGGDWEKFTSKYGVEVKPSRKNTRLIGFMSLAASITLVVGVSLYLMKSNKTPFTEYLAESVVVPEQTTLSLANGKQVALSGRHSVVEVDNEGRLIDVTNSQVIESEEALKEEAPGINQIVVPYGKTAQVDLADGTKVWLNAGSRFVFPSHFNHQKKREVVLVGEAFFDVAHDANQPFKVITDEMEYTVLGTSFNIQSYSNGSSVSAVLVEGSLQVEKRTLVNRQKVILKPGEISQFYIGPNEMRVTSVNTSFYTSWKDGYLMLDKKRLDNLVRQIEHYYHSDLVISEELMKMPTQLSGKLLLDENPEQVYQALCDLTGMTYEIINNKVIFDKK